jgi:hypothetical protein
MVSMLSTLLRDMNRNPPLLIPHSHVVFAYLLCPHAPVRHNDLQMHVAARHAMIHIEALYD